MSDRKPVISVLIPNPKIDELIAREAFQKGGPKMGMSEFFLSLVLPDDLDKRLAELRELQKNVPPSAFKRGRRKQLFDFV